MENTRLQLKKTSSGIGYYIFAMILALNAVSVLLMVLAIIVDGSLKNPAYLLLDNIASISSMFIIGLFYCLFSKTQLNDVFPLKKISLKMAAATVTISLALALLANFFADLFVGGISLFGIKNYAEMDFTTNNPVEIILNIIAISIIPALSEEFAFRGIILSKLRKYGNGFAVFISALLFGFLHGNIVQIPFAFIVGLGLAFVTIKTSSIVPAIITHFLNNLSSVIISIIEENKLMDEEIADGFYYLFLIIVFILAVFISYKLSQKSFFNLKKYTLIPFKERVKAVFTSSGIIVALAAILLEVILSVIPYGK
ncbi:MAG: CPBP family intramembrane metalloprotease [Ruminococcus sp.]|nr:CPBP family intramembrane metalloprotease [Ruminococcus sp.]